LAPQADVLTASQERAPTRVDSGRFGARGYMLAQSILPPEEVDRLRGVAREVMDELEGEGLVDAAAGPEGTVRVTKCDLLSIDRMRGVLLDGRLISAVRGILGGDPIYFGDSSLRIGASGERAWHRDHPHPTEEGSTVLRCGLYLQDHSRHSEGLAVRPYSHRVFIPVIRRTYPKLVASGPGDLVAWDLRTMHLGEAVRLRGLSSLPLPSGLLSRLPQSARLPEERERMAIFMSFGLPGSYLDDFVAYLKSRDYMQETWSRSRFGPEVWQAAEGAGLKVLAPTPEYGSAPGS
jgi:hypothetical protein